MNRRLIGLLAALVLAGIATFFLVTFVTSADERARSGEELAEVFVAQGDIPAGTVADDAIAQGLIDQDQVPARTIPSGAIGALEQISGQLATGPLFTGEIIVSGRFGDAVAQASGLMEIPEGLHAITVQIGVPEGVAGFIQAGSTVGVVGTAEVPAGAPGFGQGGAIDDDVEGEATPRSEYLVRDATVLAIGQRVVNVETEDGTTGEAVQQSNDVYLVTLAASPEDVEKLVWTTQQGTLWFTLVPDGEETGDTPGRTRVNAFG
ncbi:Flp pilus assembly protein CpaB [Nitriliruptor alkaliphilus]|uniref:Flp pilus assembly protein CpaB n=1 Tax=Nitriliruptor alkaliphilus TaxID=427918 RepID=UPI0006973FA3|nr:Flp pilus assembly protein CpaB [Nitriliruptor alkaliphilus]